MDTLASSPYVWLKFDEQGTVDESCFTKLNQIVSDPKFTDLVVMSHGWKNDMNDAKMLYGTLWKNTCTERATRKADAAQRTIVAGISWPAKAYLTDFDELQLSEADDGAALSTRMIDEPNDLSADEFERILDGFAELIGQAAAPTIVAARAAAFKLTRSNSQNLVHEGAHSLGLTTAVLGNFDGELRRFVDAMEQAKSDSARAQDLLDSLAVPPTMTINGDGAVTLGLGSVLKGVVTGARAAVARLLNQLTYWEMKKRAGIVGESLSTALLSRLTPRNPIRLHLVGHSFGARLVTAAADRLMPPTNVEFRSLTLLQGAFSHNGLAQNISPGVSGAFPNVVGKPKGVISITHTHNDRACTIAYPLASRLSLDNRLALGDASDPFGAMGANGPQMLPSSAIERHTTSQTFAPKIGLVNTFLADDFIIKTADTDAHNNVTNPTAGRLLAATLDV